MVNMRAQLQGLDGTPQAREAGKLSAWVPFCYHKLLLDETSLINQVLANYLPLQH